MTFLRFLPAIALLACAPARRGPCDSAPTGVARSVEKLPFTIPPGLLPDPQFDGRAAELAVHVVKPVYAHGKCPDVATHALVLVHGRLVPATPSFDVRARDAEGRSLSLQEALASAGIATYAPDLLGYGSSSRLSLDDPCNASLRSCADPNAPFPEGCDASANPIFALDQQASELRRARCPHSSGVRFGGTDVWVRDLRQVIDFALDDARPDGGKVALLGYSAGGIRVGRALDSAAIAAKVSRVIFVSSIFGGPTEEPRIPLTFPMTVSREPARAPDPPACAGRTIAGSNEQLWAQALEDDGAGRTWGEHGVVRAPTFTTYGWNPEVAGRLHTPALILQGLDDVAALGQPPLFGARSACAIYDALRGDKILVRVGCATHGIVVQGRGAHATVKAAVIEWVKKGTFQGQTGGSFVVDAAGVASEAVCVTPAP